MQRRLPAWFKADNIFSSNGCWYIGSVGSLNIGPYASRDVAESRSKLVVQKLKALANDEDQLRYVQKFLHDEWELIGEGTAPEEDALVEEIDLQPPPVQVRDGEQQKLWYRSARAFQVDGVWFFATREGVDVGPFDSEPEAKKNEHRLISLLLNAKTPEEALRTINEYKHRPDFYGNPDSVRFQRNRKMR